MKTFIAHITNPLTIQRLIVGCVSLTIIFFVLYIYFVSSSISQVVLRKELAHDMVVLNTQIADLESKYINAQHQVSQTIASLDGFTPVETKIFIDRSADTLVLSENKP